MIADNNTRGKVETFLTDWMDREGIPGLSVAIVGNGDVYTRGLGSRDLEANDPATADTLYGIASCTKSFTATAILQLAEDGKLDVHDPVTDHLPFDIWEEADPPVTIHDLLTHSSGFPDDGSTSLLLRRKLGFTNRTAALGTIGDLRRFVERTERVANPGEAYFYHNTGYVLLGEIVAYRSDTPFDQYIRENILNPLEMTRSTFHKEEITADGDTLTPYLLTKEGPERNEFPHGDITRPAGGLLSSVSELSNYLRMQLNDGEFKGQHILSEESVKRMREGYVQWDYAMSGSDNDYGYGWSTKEFMDERVLSHIGDILVSSAYIGFLPERDIGTTVLANSSPEYIMQSVGEGVLSLLLDGDPVEDVPFWSVREKLSQLTGQYATCGGVLSGEVIREGTTLFFRSDGVPELSFRLIPKTTERNDFRFYTMAEEGYRKSLRVDAEGDSVDIYLGRWRLRKQ